MRPRQPAQAPGREHSEPHAVAPGREALGELGREQSIEGGQLLGFGDGHSETLEVKRVGGTAVGIASSEPPETGVHAMKRAMLAELGADLIVPDYAMQEALLAWLLEAP